jgi:hypothetical protein
MNDDLFIERILRNPPAPIVPPSLRGKLQADLESLLSKARAEDAPRSRHHPWRFWSWLRHLTLARGNVASLVTVWVLTTLLRVTTPGTEETNGPRRATAQMWTVLAKHKRALLAGSGTYAREDIDSPKPSKSQLPPSTNAPNA